MLFVWLISTVLVVLWIHYATRWVRFGPPSWTSALLTSAMACTALAYALFKVVMSPPVFGLALGTAIALTLLVGGMMILIAAIQLLLRDTKTAQRPTWLASVGLSTSTLAAFAAPFILINLVISVLSVQEAA